MTPLETQRLLAKYAVVRPQIKAVEKWKTPERNRRYYLNKKERNPEKMRVQSRLRVQRFRQRQKALRVSFVKSAGFSPQVRHTVASAEIVNDAERLLKG